MNLTVNQSKVKELTLNEISQLAGTEVSQVSIEEIQNSELTDTNEQSLHDDTNSLDSVHQEKLFPFYTSNEGKIILSVSIGELKKGPGNKFTYEDVKKYIENAGYILLSTEYINSRVKLEIQCPKGHKFYLGFSDFKCRGTRCSDKTCIRERISQTNKFTYEYVKKYIENAGYILLSTEYIGARVKLEIQCPKGHKFYVGFSDFSCQGTRCSDKTCIRERVKKTCQERYGANSPLQNEQIRDRIKEILRERYGVDHHMQINEVKEKMKETCRERYGYDSPLQDPEIKAKVMATCRERYGYDSPLQDPEIRAKAMATCLERYGVDNAAQHPDIKAKTMATCEERYGYGCALQNPDIKAKSRATCQEKYGTDFAMQNPVMRAKMMATCLERYGVEYAMQHPVIRAKIIATCLERYGVENVMQHPDIRAKIIATCNERYGYSCTLQDPGVNAKARATCQEKYGTDYAMQNPVIRAKIISTCLERYGVENVMHNPEIARKCMKAAFKVKEYEFPSGRVGYTQGYENLCLDYLLENGINEDDIILSYDGGVPTIPYINQENKNAVYFPDMHTPNTNTIIEVKSIYTYEKEKEKNHLKFDAVIKAGYNLYVYIFDGKHQLVDILASCQETDNELLSYNDTL